jgi:hypothetical protein
MHECSKKCLYDDDLYFEAKYRKIFATSQKRNTNYRADYVRKRELFREAQVPYENAEYILESVKLGQKLYYTGRVWDQRNFHPDTIQFIRKHSKEVNSEKLIKENKFSSTERTMSTLTKTTSSSTSAKKCWRQKSRDKLQNHELKSLSAKFQNTKSFLKRKLISCRLFDLKHSKCLTFTIIRLS